MRSKSHQRFLFHVSDSTSITCSSLDARSLSRTLWIRVQGQCLATSSGLYRIKGLMRSRSLVESSIESFQRKRSFKEGRSKEGEGDGASVMAGSEEVGEDDDGEEEGELRNAASLGCTSRCFFFGWDG